MKLTILAALFAAGTLALPGYAQTPSEHDAHHANAAADAPIPLTAAEVRKVDKDAGKITLRHEAIPSLEMPPMTMVFRVSDPSFLERVKPGDKVRFAAEKVGGLLTVTQLEPLK